MESSKLFVECAKGARGLIAQRARGLVRDGSIILTCGNSRVVKAVLDAAAKEGVQFRVIYATEPPSAPSTSSRADTVESLRAQEISVAVIPFALLGTAITQASSVMIGAESVVENGGILSGIGGLQMSILAKSKGKAVYVVAESYKFVRYYPLKGEGEEIGIAGTLDFRTGTDVEGRSSGCAHGRLEYIPPELITALVTETGVHTPSSVSEELIKIWY